MITYN